MKKLLITVFAIFIFIAVEDAVGAGNLLYKFNEVRNSTQESGMLVLGSWAAGNILAGSIMTGQSSGSAKYFWQMNIFWNVVNLGIAGFGYYDAVNADAGLSFLESISEQKSLEGFLLLNTGLDVAYAMGGLFMIEKSKSSEKYSDLLKGYGQSLILQGAFLFAFDISLYFIHNSHWELLQGIDFSLSALPGGLSLSLKF